MEEERNERHKTYRIQIEKWQMQVLSVIMLSVSGLNTPVKRY